MPNFVEYSGDDPIHRDLHNDNDAHSRRRPHYDSWARTWIFASDVQAISLKMAAILIKLSKIPVVSSLAKGVSRMKCCRQERR
jgi:hypothetical protein